MARSILHKRVRQLRASPRQVSQPNKADMIPQSSVTSSQVSQLTSTDNKEPTIEGGSASSAVKNFNQTLSGIYLENNKRALLRCSLA